MAGGLTTCTDSTAGTDYIYKCNLFLPIKKKTNTKDKKWSY